MHTTDRSKRTPRDAWRILFRHRRKALGFFVVVVGAVTAATLLSPRIYQSQGKLLVRLGRENVGLDPTTTIGREATLSVPNTREEEINSVAEILRSRVVIEHAVDAVTPAAILAGEEASGSLSPRDRAILNLDEKLAVYPISKSNVLGLAFEHRDPEVSRRVVDAVMDAFLAEHVRLHRTPQSYEFLKEQTAEARRKLREAEDELKELENASGLVSPALQRDQLVARIGRIEEEILQAESQAVALEAELDRLRDVLSGGPTGPVTAAAVGVATDSLDSARGQLYSLQLREKELLSRYTEQYVEVRQVRDQIAATRQFLESEEQARHLRKWPQRTYEDTQIALVTKQPQLEALRVKRDRLDKQLAELRSDLKVMHDRELEIARLRREAGLLETRFRRYAESFEQASIDQELQRERISNISIVQPAVTDIKPVKPKRALNLALGVAFGLMGGLALAVAAEYFDHTLKTPDDVEKHLGLPVLASVPELRARELAA
jgi:uncharacterized protein involved in exopolysaccharide biosynthesis